MADFLLYVLKLNVLAALLIVLIMSVSGFLSKKYSVWWRSWIWLAVSLVLLVPVQLPDYWNVIHIQIPQQVTEERVSEVNEEVRVQGQEGTGGSKYFDVSLDYLMKEENSISENAVSLEVHQTEATNKREKRILGIATCIIGVVLLIAWGIVSVFMPSASEQIGTSSMITIDGNGIFLLICLVAIIAGAVLLLKSTSNK